MRLSAEDSLLRRLESALHGTAPSERVAPEPGDDRAFAELLGALEQEGLLASAALMAAGRPAIGLC